MVDPLTLLAFAGAALVLNLTPGADMLFCLGQGLRSGPRAGWAASAGVSTGSMVHVTVAGLGLSAALAAVPGAFDAIRWAGAAYLVWLAIAALRGGAAKHEAGMPMRPVRAYISGMVVNLLNPKVILFVLAFVPQFVDPGRPVLAQFIIFGAVIAIGGLFVNGMVAQLAGGAGRHLVRSGRALDYITAGIFSALAVRLVMGGQA